MSWSWGCTVLFGNYLFCSFLFGGGKIRLQWATQTCTTTVRSTWVLACVFSQLYKIWRHARVSCTGACKTYSQDHHLHHTPVVLSLRFACGANKRETHIGNHGSHKNKKEYGVSLTSMPYAHVPLFLLFCGEEVFAQMWAWTVCTQFDRLPIVCGSASYAHVFLFLDFRVHGLYSNYGPGLPCMFSTYIRTHAHTQLNKHIW